MRKPLRKAIFPVGGLGTRFLPATKAMPKEMLPVVDKPLIQYAVEEARAAGIEELIFVTGRGKSAIEDHFDYSYELQETLKERQQGRRAGADRQPAAEPGRRRLYPPAGGARPRPRGVVRAQPGRQRAVRGAARRRSGAGRDAVPEADGRALQRGRRQPGGGDGRAEGAHRPLRHPARPARRAGGWSRRSGLVEKPKPEEAPSTLSIIGRYILQPDVFAHLDKQSPGAGGEIQLTDAMALMCGRGRFHGYRFEGTALRLRRQGRASSRPTSPSRSVIRRSAARCGTPCSRSPRT